MKRLAATVLSLIIVLGTITSFRLYQFSFPTPTQAVNEFFARVTKDTPGEVKSITVVSDTPSVENRNVRTLLFRATGLDPDMYIVGYAVTKKTLFGWYVETSQTSGRSPRPEDVLVDLGQFNEKQVVYGQVFLAGAATVEAVFSDSGDGQKTLTSELRSDHFVLFGSPYQELLQFKILDSNGRVLKQFTPEELQNQ